MFREVIQQPSGVAFRTGLFLILLLTINFVMDGLPQAASPFVVQLALLPITIFFLLAFWCFLFNQSPSKPQLQKILTFAARPGFLSLVVLLFETGFVVLFLYETRHFAALGYRLLLIPVAAGFGLALVTLFVITFLRERLSPAVQLVAFLSAYAVGQILAIASFPLNYLRSDMLPVIYGADRALLAGQSPYRTFYIGDRLYDFPYLPGMLLAFLPAQAMHLDLRWAAMAYIVGGMCLIYWATAPQFRSQAVLLIGLFVLCPYLQYRHDLYTQGHFFSLILIFVLMQRRRFAWSAVVFGISMVVSQFSWVIFPFFLLNALRRAGWKEVFRMAGLALGAALLVWLPFLSSSTGAIAHNAVGQWDRLTRPIARPINLSFWVSYVVRPSHLKWVQLALLTAVFCFCWLRGRCGDLADTLRWTLAALLLFILLNVLVDGYFYLMLLVPMLVYTCVANGWWLLGPDPPSPLPILATSRFF